MHALLGRLDQPAHLVGHTCGGAVALSVARNRSDLLRSLTVVEPVAFHLLRGGGASDEHPPGSTRATQCWLNAPLPQPGRWVTVRGHTARAKLG